MEPLAKSGERDGIVHTGDNALHRAVVTVAYPAVQAKSIGLRACCLPEPHALDPTGHDEAI